MTTPTNRAFDPFGTPITRQKTVKALAPARQGFIDGVRERIARDYLRMRSSTHLRRCDQQVVFSFDWISQSIALDGVYERAELEFVSNAFRRRCENKVILDVGANIGNHTRVFSRMAAGVIALEPNPATFKVLRINTERMKNVRILNLGASDRAATLKARVPVGNLGGSSLESNEGAPRGEADEVEFEVVPLDTIAEIAASDIGFVKIDVEGHELRALRGMKHILSSQDPIVAFEQNRGIYDGTSDVMEYLRSLGYRYFYELLQQARWLVPQALPRILRRPLRFAEAMIAGLPSKELRLAAVTRLSDRPYNFLLAAKSPLASDEGC